MPGGRPTILTPEWYEKSTKILEDKIANTTVDNIMWCYTIAGIADECGVCDETFQKAYRQNKEFFGVYNRWKTKIKRTLEVLPFTKAVAPSTMRFILKNCNGWTERLEINQAENNEIKKDKPIDQVISAIKESNGCGCKNHKDG